MGAGNTFRDVATALLAGGANAGQYYLNRKELDREQQRKLAQIEKSKTTMSPEQIALMEAQTGYYNRGRIDGGGGGGGGSVVDRRINEYIKQKEIELGRKLTPIEASKTKSYLLQANLLGQNELAGIEDIFATPESPQPISSPEPPKPAHWWDQYVSKPPPVAQPPAQPPQAIHNVGGGQPPVVQNSNTPPPAPPPKFPGETAAQYTKRTGILVK